MGGSVIEELEEKLADLCDVKYCIALNSGTDALVCGLKALGVRNGDEVITPPNSFIASTAAIILIGAIPVFADVLPDQNIDPDCVEKSITAKTKAIMPVHLTGRLAQMDRLVEIAKKFNIPIIEDAAQAIGSSFQKKLAGSWGKVGCFSTHPLKNLNACGDGGFLLTNEKDISLNVRRMRNHGLVDRNYIENFGFVSRMDSLQAGILLFRLRNLYDNIEKRRKNADYYANNIEKNKVYIPFEKNNYYNTYHTFVIQCDYRDKLKEYLLSKGIETAIHYPIPIHLQSAARSLNYKKGDFPNAEKQSSKILSLPVNQFLVEKQLEYITHCINEFYK